MIRKLLCLMVAIFAFPMLFGCTERSAPSETTYPILPSFPQEQTPKQQLAAALEKAAAQSRYTMRLGSSTEVDGSSDEQAQVLVVDREHPLDRSVIMEYLPELPNSPNFLETFGNSPLRAIPSNSGLVRYQLSDLSWEEACQILYMDPPPGEWDDALCGIALEVDGLGRFTRLEICFETDTIRRVFLTMEYPDDP